MIQYYHGEEVFEINKSTGKIKTKEHIEEQPTSGYSVYQFVMDSEHSEKNRCDSDEIEEKIVEKSNRKESQKEEIEIKEQQNNTIEEVKIEKPILEIAQEDKDRLNQLLELQNIEEASFYEVKVWTLLHCIIRMGCDLELILKLKNQDIIWESNVCNIFDTSGNINKLTLHSKLIPVLQIYMNRRKGKPDDFLFCNEQGKEWTIENCRLQVEKYCKQREIDHFQLDKLRYQYI